MTRSCFTSRTPGAARGLGCSQALNLSPLNRVLRFGLETVLVFQ